MTKIGMIRCEKNENTCPLTNCIKCHDQAVQGFSGYDECSLAGVFTCRCPGDNFADMVKILKAKGAESVHVVTCTFSKKDDGVWKLENGFCDKIDELARNAAAEAGIPVTKGTAHLPENYKPEVFR
ncbi:CGGC domain-containing protein [Maridesulfovibrio sp.]|uniref:CGGC domain-containing protein n=1 Tax=Maridesulfovibrio sp. TaxID=2795000 RepID=UPI002A18A228|nr:CGGC domain-containing protein [Maridesulfovibrio sp.]